MRCLCLYLSQLESVMERAESNMTDAIKERWPEGTLVEVFIMHGQINPTAGEVIAHYKNHIRVRLDTKNQHIKDIHFSKVIYP